MFVPMGQENLQLDEAEPDDGAGGESGHAEGGAIHETNRHGFRARERHPNANERGFLNKVTESDKRWGMGAQWGSRGGNAWCGAC
jgi:hypothetical protein